MTNKKITDAQNTLAALCKREAQINGEISRLQQSLCDLTAEKERARCVINQQIVEQVDALLSLAKHNRTSCSDENPSNVREACPRCVLLYAKQGGFWPDEFVMTVEVRKR